MSRNQVTRNFVRRTFVTRNFATRFLNKYDSDAEAYFNQLIDMPSSIMRGYYNTFFLNLKTGIINGTNTFSLFERLWWRGAEIKSNNLVCLNNPTAPLVEEINGIGSTWQQFKGYVPDGISMYLDLHFNPLTDLIVGSRDSFTVTVYSRTNVNGFLVDMGALNTAVTQAIQMDIRDGSNFYADINDNASFVSPVANADSLALQTMTRTSSTNIDLYSRGASLGSLTNTATVIPNFSMYESSRNRNNVAENFSTRQLLFSGIASKMTANNVADLYAAVQAFATSIGSQV